MSGYALEIFVPVLPLLRKLIGHRIQSAIGVVILAASFSFTNAVAALATISPVGALVMRTSGRIAALRLAQDDDTGSDTEIPPDQVQKYIAVYKDMQHDRSLSVEQAAGKEGMSISEFRGLEQKIERDEPTREHVRDELESEAPAQVTPVPAK